jgi:hypothetical protein
MLAAQTVGDDRRQTPHDQTISVDQHPFLAGSGLSGLCGIGCHDEAVPGWNLSMGGM